MAGKFELYAGKSDTRFRLKAGHGEIIGTSEMHSAASFMENGIASLKMRRMLMSLIRRSVWNVCSEL